MSSTKKPLWRWRRNPLKRGLDRVEAWAGLTAACAALFAAPTTGVLAGDALADNLRDKSGWHRTTGVLLEDAHPLGSSSMDTENPQVFTTVEWHTQDGTSHTGQAPVRAGSQAHTKVTVWLDSDGAPRLPPPSSGAASAQGAAVGGLAGAGTVLVIVAGYGVVRHRIGVRSAREWEREWAQVGPHWSEHT
jgi:hypothetical protein